MVNPLFAFSGNGFMKLFDCIDTLVIDGRTLGTFRPWCFAGITAFAGEPIRKPRIGSRHTSHLTEAR
jgi:hypothetical protein